MHWVIQNNIYREEGYERLLTQLDRQGTTYDLVKIIPFSDGCIEPDVNPEGPVYVIGALTMSKCARNHGWSPGYIDENIDMLSSIKHWGRMMLNGEGSFVSTFAKAEYVGLDRFHLRPIKDDKSFVGNTYTWTEFDEWRKQVLDLQDTSFTTLTADDLVLMSPIKTIYAEYRFYVVNGRVITGSLYREGSRVVYREVLPKDPAWTFAVAMTAPISLDSWLPNKAFALDVALTPDGYRIVETGALNSVGFYACDMGKFVAAINELSL